MCNDTFRRGDPRDLVGLGNRAIDDDGRCIRARALVREVSFGVCRVLCAAALVLLLALLLVVAAGRLLWGPA